MGITVEGLKRRRRGKMQKWKDGIVKKLTSGVKSAGEGATVPTLLKGTSVAAKRRRRDRPSR